MSEQLSELCAECGNPKSSARHGWNNPFMNICGADLPHTFIWPHPFDNNGSSTGVCRVCDGIAPEHETVKLVDGSVIALIKRPGLVKVIPSEPAGIAWSIFVDTNGEWWEVRGSEMRKLDYRSVYPRCATCKWWKQGDPFDEPFMPEKGAWGTCEKLSEETGVHVMEYFYTNPDFGCVQHEEKP